MTTYVLRPARRGDLSGVRSLWRSVRREYRLASAWTREEPGAEDGELWVVEAGRGEIVGSCGLREADSGLWELHSLNLSPDWRGFGLGRALVERAVHSAQDQGALAVEALVPREMSDGAAFLGRLGFAETAEPRGEGLVRFVLVLARSH